MGGVEISDIGFFLPFWVVYGGWKMDTVVFGIILVDFQEFLSGILVGPSLPTPAAGDRPFWYPWWAVLPSRY